MIRRLVKTAFLALLALSVATIVMLGLRAVFASDDAEQGNRSSPRVTVETAAIERATVRDVRSISGTLQPRSRSLIASRIGGHLQEMRVDIGDAVESGQVIALLDDDEFQQAVDQARAELRVAEANLAESRSRLDIARREHARIQRLHAQQIASESELDSALAELEANEARVRVNESQVSRAEAQLRAADVRLSYATIRPQWPNPNGPRVIGERFVDEGSNVAANEPIVSVLDIDTLTAVVYVSERDYTRLRVGQIARVLSDSYPGEPFEGRIVRLAPEFREASRQARVEIEVANPEHRLKPGMFVRLEIELGRAEDVLVVPREALVRRHGEQGVFLVQHDDMTVRFVPVRTGIREGSLVQLVEPFIEGEVITLGQHLLDDGIAIRLPRERAAEPAPEAPGVRP